MIAIVIEERLAELDAAVAELKAIVDGESGSDVSLSLTEQQSELEAERQELMKVVLRRVGERS